MEGICRVIYIGVNLKFIIFHNGNILKTFNNLNDCYSFISSIVKPYIDDISVVCYDYKLPTDAYFYFDTSVKEVIDGESISIIPPTFNIINLSDNSIVAPTAIIISMGKFTESSKEAVSKKNDINNRLLLF